MIDIIGHTQIVAMFDRLLQNNQLSHAYCLVGPAHIGKHKLAIEVAAQYLGVTSSNLALHPDVLQISPEEKENGKIKIDTVRSCKEFLSQTSVHGHGLVVLINDAHTMTEEAANSLLKSLEEPPQKTLIILITPFEKLVPETIRSRCQIVQCGTMSKQDIKKTLLDRGVSIQDADTYTAFADGRIGIALACVDSLEIADLMKMYQTQSERLQTTPLYEKIQLAHDIADDENLSLSERVTNWCVSDMERLRQEVLDTGVINYKQATYLCRYPELLKTLRSNTNKQLTLEQFLF